MISVNGVTGGVLEEEAVGTEGRGRVGDRGGSTGCYDPDSRGPLFSFLSRPLSFSHPLSHLLPLFPLPPTPYLPFVVSFPPPVGDLPFLVACIPGCT